MNKFIKIRNMIMAIDIIEIIGIENNIITILARNKNPLKLEHIDNEDAKKVFNEILEQIIHE